MRVSSGRADVVMDPVAVNQSGGEKMSFGSRRWKALHALAVVSVVVLTACGTSSGTPTSNAPVHFDAQGSFTGLHIATGLPILEGDKAGAYVVNQNGGIMGHQLIMDTVDDVGDEADAVPALNREISVNNPIFIVGFTTDEIHGVQSIFDRHHLIDGWNGGDTHYDNNTDQWLWRCNASDSQLGVAVAAEAYDKGYRNAVIFMSTASSTQTLTPIIANAFKALGGNVAGIVNIVPGQSSYRSEVQKAVSYHPDVILTQMEPSTGAVALADFKEVNNLSVPFIGTDLTGGSDFIKAIGPAVAKQHFLSVEGSNALTAAGKTFSDAYMKVNGHAPLGGSAFAYDCVIDFALAITKAKSFDDNVWVKSIVAVSNPPGTTVSDYKQGVDLINAGTKIDYEGASGPMDFNQFHNVSGAWDIVQSNGDAAGDITTVNTITAVEIQAIVNKMGTS
jgi:ABC-type branched-subunit amino acid transport system substrate-binding protein